MSQLLSFLKPDAVLRKNIGIKVLKELSSDSQLTVQSFQRRKLNEAVIEEHYEHVKTRPFYDWLVGYVASSPIYVMLIEVNSGDETVNHLRDLLGHTLSHIAEAETVRNRYGIYAGVNCLHVSDSLESGELEVALWKKRLGISEGQFELSINEFLDENNDNIPDNTQKIRELCFAIAKNGCPDTLSTRKIFDLLCMECPNVSKEELDSLVSTVVDSCFY